MRTYGGADQDWLNCRGHHRTTGASSPPASRGCRGGTNPDIYLLKVSGSGVRAVVATVERSRQPTRPTPLLQTSDGGYFTAGYTAPTGSSITDCYIVKTDSTGQQEWARVYGGPQADVAWTAVQTLHEGFVIAGETNSFGHGNYDYYAVTTTAAPQPGDTVRDLRVHYDPDGAGIELRWTVPRPGEYDDLQHHQSQRAGQHRRSRVAAGSDVRIATPVAVWTDPDPLAEKKYYVVAARLRPALFAPPPRRPTIPVQH